MLNVCNVEVGDAERSSARVDGESASGSLHYEVFAVVCLWWGHAGLRADTFQQTVNNNDDYYNDDYYNDDCTAEGRGDNVCVGGGGQRPSTAPWCVHVQRPRQAVRAKWRRLV